MKTTSYTNARKNLASMMNEACEDKAPILITRSHHSPVVMVSLEEWNAIEETAYLTQSEANRLNLNDSIKELKDGEVVDVSSKFN